MKVLKILGLSFLGFCVAALALFAIVNAVDEPPLAQVEVLLKKAPAQTEAGTRAFYYFLGVRAGEKAEPELQGRELWAKGTTLPAAEQNAFFENKLGGDVWSSPNVYPKGPGALSAEMKARPELGEELEKKGFALDQYLRLIEYGEFSHLQASDLFSRVNSAPQKLLQAHHYLELQFGKLAGEGRWTEIERLIRLENHFMQSFFKDDTLLSTMIADIIIFDNAHFLDAEVKLQPALKISRATLDSFRVPPPKILIENALETELRYFAAVFKKLDASELSQIFFQKETPVFKVVPVRLLADPNEAINKYYMFMQDELIRSCGNEDCSEALKWAHPRWPWGWLRNPAGKYLLGMFTDHLGNRFNKLELRRQEMLAILERLRK